MNSKTGDYAKLLNADTEPSTPETSLSRTESAGFSAIGASVPITKPPSTPRDIFYGLLYIAHLIGIGVLISYEETAIRSYLKKGTSVEWDSWASLGMIASLIGATLGALLLMLLLKSKYRDTLLGMSITSSIVLEIGFANILFLLNTDFSFVGITLLISAIIDACWYKIAKDNISFISALVSAVLEVNKNFQWNLLLICISILFLQTCYLFVFSVITVTFLSVVSTQQSYLTLACLITSFCWVTVFYRSMMGFIISGSYLWFYAADEYNASSNGGAMSLSSRVYVNLKSSLLANFGTIAKVSLFGPFSESILRAERWSLGTRNTIPTKVSIAWVVYAIISPSLPFARENHSFYLGYSALFGLTLKKASAELAMHPEILAIHAEDVSGYVLNSLSVFLAGVIAILFGLLARDREGEEWPLFFIFCFWLAYTGLSYAMHAIKSGINTLILASVLYPTKFQKEHPILYSRFNRLSEIDLR